MPSSIVLLCLALRIISMVHVAFAAANYSTVRTWDEASKKAFDFVSQLNLTEKAILVTGDISGSCGGNIDAIPRLNFSGLCLQDGPTALRVADLVTVFPAGIATAASWDKDLMYIRGSSMGAEFRAKGANVLLGPVASPLGRHPLGGRNWEGFGPDPYLTGIAMEETIRGIQDAGVQACAKHYIGNEQETQRSNTTVDGVGIDAISSNIDDRTLHELYLWPFANAVRAGVASLMCSYNRLNKTYACENSRTLKEILRGELGFRGYVMSDWFATHSGVSSIEAGLDMTMPGPTDQNSTQSAGLGGLSSLPSFFGSSLIEAVTNGTLNESVVDTMIERIMTPYFFLGQDLDFPTVDPSSLVLLYYTYGLLLNTVGYPAARDVRDNHTALVRTLGAESTVLLKNTRAALPLTNVASVGVFGNDAPDIFDGLYYMGDPSVPLGPTVGTIFTGGGSGSGRAVDVISPLQAIRKKGEEDGFRVSWILDNDLLAKGDLTAVFPTPDACIVFLRTFAMEGIDRSAFELDYESTKVVESVALHCPNTIVVTHSAGINTMPWAENPNVTAILAAHYPGEQTGNSIVDILWGSVNPSGKLPYTIPRSEADYDVPIVNVTGAESTDPNAWQSDFTDELMIDYRRFDSMNITPLYEFGYGLSYTTFTVSSCLNLTKTGDALSAFPKSLEAGVPPGGNDELWTSVLVVTAVITNNGSLPGATVPQLYVSLEAAGSPPGTPVRVLRGFEKIYLQPGESAPVRFELARRDVSFWNVADQEWQIPDGSIELSVGFSSRDLRACATVTLVR